MDINLEAGDIFLDDDCLHCNPFILYSGNFYFRASFSFEALNPFDSDSLLTIYLSDGSVFVHVPLHLSYIDFWKMNFSHAERAVIRIVMHYLNNNLPDFRPVFIEESHLRSLVCVDIFSLAEASSNWID
jgi:hypothetical protein